MPLPPYATCTCTWCVVARPTLNTGLVNSHHSAQQRSPTIHRRYVRCAVTCCPIPYVPLRGSHAHVPTPHYDPHWRSQCARPPLCSAVPSVQCRAVQPVRIETLSVCSQRQKVPAVTRYYLVCVSGLTRDLLVPVFGSWFAQARSSEQHALSSILSIWSSRSCPIWSVLVLFLCLFFMGGEG